MLSILNFENRQLVLRATNFASDRSHRTNNIGPLDRRGKQGLLLRRATQAEDDTQVVKVNLHGKWKCFQDIEEQLCKNSIAQ